MQLTFVFALIMLQAVGAIRVDPNPQPPEKEQFVAPFVTMPLPSVTLPAVKSTVPPSLTISTS